MKIRIIVLHVYQDKHNPEEQTIVVNADYATNYALFKALIDSHLDFGVEIAKDEDED